jgi:hypothetical protein
MTRTVVALYDDLTMAHHAVRDLVDAGIPRDNISLVASDAAGEYSRYMENAEPDAVTADEGAGFGAVVGALTGALVGLGALAVPGVGPVLAAGPLLAALGGGAVGAVAGGITGGIIGGLVKTGVTEEDAHFYAESVRRGGTLVSATVDDAMVNRVEEIMNRHNPVDINRRSEYFRSTGWSAFDEKSKPYSAQEINKDRETYRNYSTKMATSTTGRDCVRTYDRSTRV